jgi:hypothetical protein
VPTAGKLIAALCLCALALALSEVIKSGFDPGMRFGLFGTTNAALGLVLGWVVIGRRTGQGIAVAVSTGLTGAVALVFWALAIQATNEMIGRAMARRYSGPAEAFDALFAIAAEYGARILTVEFAVVLVLGGALSGVLAEAAARVWR